MEEDKNKRIVVEEVEETPARSTPVVSSIPAAKEEPVSPVRPIESANSAPKPKEQESGSFLKLGILSFLSGMILGGAIVGGIFYFQTKVGEPTAVPTPTPENLEPQPVEQIEEPVVEVLDLTKYSVSVLNGSGKAGEAGVVKTLLELDKYKSIDTGNAAKYNFTDTQVAVKEGLPDGIYDAVRDRLKSKYSVVKAEKFVVESSDYDIVVTVGSKFP